MHKLLLILVVFLSSASCRAEEVRISCRFGQPLFVPDMDAEASRLRQGFNASNLERVVLLELSAPKVVNTDMLFRLFPDGGKVVTVSNEQIVVAWGADEHPRSPKMVLTVNRFSLEAYEYFQMKKLGAGREVYEWTRDGSCKVDKRQF